MYYGYKYLTFIHVFFKILDYFYERIPLVVKNPYENEYNIRTTVFETLPLATKISSIVLTQPKSLDQAKYNLGMFTDEEFKIYEEEDPKEEILKVQIEKKKQTLKFIKEST